MSTTIFVNKKSDVTEYLNKYIAQGLNVYRTRLNCLLCPPGQNRRSGILAIDTQNERIQVKVIKCKHCAKGGAHV